jgi:signal transduction histidine kinase
LYEHLLPPIANILITSEALLAGRYGDLLPDQCESLEVIHLAALRTFTYTRDVVEQQPAATTTLEALTHDWLTPSATIISFCDYLLEEVDGRLLPAQQARIQQIFYQAHYLRRQTYNLLDYSKIQRQEMRPLTTFDLPTLFTPDLINIEQAVPLLWDVQPDLPPVYSARLYVHRTLSNLLANALTYTPAGQVTVRVWCMGPLVEISVSDTGMGIPRRALRHIFEPFYRLHPHIPGKGLGLYVAKTFTAWQGGTLEVESLPGTGSTFAMTIPVAR